VVRATVVESLDHRGDGVLGELVGVLADRGQVDVCQPGDRAVVVADDGDCSRDVDTGADERVDEPHGAAVVEGEYGGRPRV
jgi:hypothetical protein